MFHVYRKHLPALLSWPYQPGSLWMYQFLRPRHRSDIWSTHTSMQISHTTRNSCQQACPTGQTKMHTVTGAHFLFLSMSHLFFTLFHRFCCRVYYFGMPLGGLFGSKITTFNSMHCSQKQVLFPVLESGQ